MSENIYIGQLQCPHCTTSVSGASSVGNDAELPTDGDISICAYCGGLLIFKDIDGQLTLVKGDENEELVRQAREQLEHYAKKYPAPKGEEQ